MRLRTVKDKDNIIESCNYLIKNPEDYKGKWQNLFGNRNPICIEIGMGKGKYLFEMAKTYPNINFIGIEKYDKVITRAIKKITEMDNLKIMCFDAINLHNVFDKEIDTIYLNFSDPWPKKRHAKRRLTSDLFLNVYENIFKSSKRIVLKTDNILLFESSIISLSNFGYIIKDISLDLKNKDISNITTEYEDKFNKLGININYLEAIKD